MKGKDHRLNLERLASTGRRLRETPAPKLDAAEGKVRAIVRYLARRAAENDYRELLRALEAAEKDRKD